MAVDNGGRDTRFWRWERNLSLKDKIFRLLLGLAVVVLALVYGSWWGLASLYLFATAAAGWSPVYQVLGASSCRFVGPEAVCDDSELVP